MSSAIIFVGIVAASSAITGMIFDMPILFVGGLISAGLALIAAAIRERR